MSERRMPEEIQSRTIGKNDIDDEQVDLNTGAPLPGFSDRPRPHQAASRKSLKNHAFDEHRRDRAIFKEQNDGIL